MFLYVLQIERFLWRFLYWQWMANGNL